MYRNFFRNLPNLFSVARLVLVPFIAAEILGGNSRMALALTVLAGLTDALDGFLARRFSLITRLGAWLDPLADKALLVTLFLTLGQVGLLPWWLVGLVLARDAIILAMAGVALAFTSIRDFPPSIWGKLSTIVQVGACVGVLIMRATLVSWPSAAVRFIVVTTALATAWSGIDYIQRGVTRWRRERTLQMR